MSAIRNIKQLKKMQQQTNIKLQNCKEILNKNSKTLDRKIKEVM